VSKYKVGDKFIIELAQEYHVRPGEPKAKDESIIPFATLFRLKGFTAATWDDNGLDRLERYVEPKPEPELHLWAKSPYRAFRPYQVLLTEPDDLTEGERIRLERIRRIPASVRAAKLEYMKALREEVILLEAKLDAASDYLEGFIE